MASFYNFPWSPPPQNQKESHALELLRAFGSFTSTQVEFLLSDREELQELEWSVALAQSDRVRWYPQYGCALVIVSVDKSLLKTSLLKLVALDDWCFATHGSGRVDFISHPGGFKVLTVGEIGPTTEMLFFECFEKLWAKAKARKGKDRTAAGGKQGHQKTPAFVLAVMEDALRGLEEPVTEPRGGFTDVGLHTGGLPRDTSWSLVQSVLQFTIERLAPLHHSSTNKRAGKWPRLIADFYRLMLWDHLCDDNFLPASRRKVDEAMHALTVAAQHGSALPENEPGRDAFARECAKARRRINSFEAERSRLTDLQWRLPTPPEIISSEVINAMLHLPMIELPSEVLVDDERPGLAKARMLAAVNLGPLPSIPNTDGPLNLLKKWLDEPKLKAGGSEEAAQLVLEEVERTVFSLVLPSLAEGDAAESGCDSVMLLQGIVDSYRHVSKQYQEVLKDEAELMVVRSKEVLLVWVVYAICHQAVIAEHPSMSGWDGVSLSVSHLGFLVLKNKLALDALQSLARYLEAHTKPEQAIFCLVNEAPTYALAREFAKIGNGNGDIAARWKAEQHDARRRVEAHWDEVQRMQELARKGRSELAMLERKLSNLQSEPHTQRFLQPLPEREENALPVLFFMLMPPLYRALASYSFLSQQMLLPETASSDLSATLRRRQPKTEWLPYVVRQRSVSNYTKPSLKEKGDEFDVRLVSFAEPPKQSKVGSSHVDRLYSRSDGVWYPDALSSSGMLTMGWSGGHQTELDASGWGRAIFNPWRHCHLRPSVLKRFTARLPSEAQDLQWVMAQGQWGGEEPDRTRGNHAIAHQSAKPTWLNKAQLFAFCGLRAYPSCQLRKLCTVLHDHLLPLEQPAVHLLFEQLLYHVGEVGTREGSTQLLWRRDAPKVFEVLASELKKLSEDLKEAQRAFRDSALLGEVAAWVSQWCEEGYDVARSFASAMREWANALEHEHHSKKGLLFLSALLCYSLVDVSPEDCQEMVELMVLANAEKVLDEGAGPQLQHLVEREAVKCSSVMASHLPRLDQLLTSKAKTEAVKLALGVVPASLAWVNVTSGAGEAAGCYEAVAEGHLYSLNILSGVVLLDGNPPGRLPPTVIQHPLYKRVFGNVNFEVKSSSEAIHTTLKPVAGGCRYEFYLNSEGDLRVIELGIGEEEPYLELLLWGAEWDKQLPVRLREMHSAWVCRKRGVVLLRPLSFLDRKVQFVISLISKDGEQQAMGECFRVPRELQSKNWPGLVTSTARTEQGELSDMLVLPTEGGYLDQFVAVLSKLEEPALVHCFFIFCKDSKKVMLRLELPRYEGIEFELQGGSLVCPNHFFGHKLKSCQQMEGELPGFKRYLILQGLQGAEELLLIPSSSQEEAKRHAPATVTHATFEPVDLNISQRCDAVLSVLAFGLHARWGDVRAPDIESRLQLASLYAATSSLLPHARLGMRGQAYAAELVRQSRVFRPLTSAEMCHLRALAGLARLPALALLCQQLVKDSAALCLLHGLEKPVSVTEALPEVTADAATSYKLSCQSVPQNPHERLTEEEELQTLGYSLSAASPMQGEITGRDCPVYAEAVPQFEEELAGMVGEEPGAESVDGYPLDAEATTTRIGRELHKELQESWFEWKRLPRQKLKLGWCEAALPAQSSGACCELHQHLRSMMSAVSEQLGEVQPYLNETMSLSSSSTWIMQQAAGTVATASRRDFARCLFDDSLLEALNPHLSRMACDSIREASRRYLELAVLQDKLERLLGYTGETLPLLLQDLLCTRQWSTSEHPKWLAYEAEGQIQIRPKQWLIFMGMKEKGAMLQLNMGEGKTRVILPMLVMDHCPASTLRLLFPRVLLAEAHHHLHSTLTASVLRVPFVELPFSRDVEVGEHPACTQAMFQCLERCRQLGGAVLMAGSHLLSMKLKSHEVALQNGVEDVAYKMLKTVLQAPTWDVLDESDALLNPRQHSIYASGAPQRMPDGKERWIAAQALLRVLAYNDRVQSILSRPGVAVSQPSDKPGQFPQLRFLKEASTEVREELAEAVAEGLFEDPPFELLWLKPLQEDKTRKDNFIQAVTDAKSHPEDLLPRLSLPGASQNTSDEDVSRQWATLLALRGLLAFGLLMEHCLERRHRVNFGVRRHGHKAKRLAVPFRASDSPAERSEFSHPDVATVYTVVSYYRDGLSGTEFREVLVALLAMGASAQVAVYQGWLDIGGIPAGGIDKPVMIDLSNKEQFERLWEHFQFNMEAINTWLNICVLPVETIMYPYKLVAGPWNLVDNGNGAVSGFTGTDDSHWVFPRQVKRVPPQHHELRATNGKMLGTLLDASYIQLPAPGGCPLWQELLLLVVSKGARAALDCGALMAGVTGKEAAEYILSQSEKPLPPEFRGVVYFVARHGWHVADRRGVHEALALSPISARDALVLYDQARCRGADLKLQITALALISIGPGTCKDDLMQAAGRMRSLDLGQKLLMVGSEEVSGKVRGVSKLTPEQAIKSKHVLQYVMHCTEETLVTSLPSWADQGITYFSTQAEDDSVLQEEHHGLEMYADAVKPVLTKDYVTAAIERRFQCVSEASVLHSIQSHANEFGADRHVRSQKAADMECERELQQEQEQEEEEEREIPKVKPRKEAIWDFKIAASSASVAQLQSSLPALKLLRLEEAATWLSIEALSKLPWCKEVWVTCNFLVATSVAKEIDCYLRPPEALLVFPGGEIVLLSEYEADGMLTAIWDRSASSHKGAAPVLVNLAYARNAGSSSSSIQLAVTAGEAATCHLSGAALASVQVFAGECTYSTKERKEAVRSLLHRSFSCIEDILRMRGLLHLLSRSHLEELWKASS
ncbi:unnamed protein product [Chrysoparadoxa australica]